MTFATVDMLFDIAPKVRGDIIYVDDDYTSEDETHKRTIQAALDAAHMTPSLYDTVYVYSGNYMEDLIVYEYISLIGEGRGRTIIDDDNNPENSNWKIYLKTDSSMKNFTIHYYDWHAVYMERGCSLKNNLIYNDGPALFDGNPHVAIKANSYCDISGNDIRGFGTGGISGNGGSINIINNEIPGSISLKGSNAKIDKNSIGGIFLVRSNSARVSNNRIYECVVFDTPDPSSDPLYGVCLELYGCNDISIFGNNFDAGDYGIKAEDSSGYMSDNFIEMEVNWYIGNNIGIYLEDSDFDILSTTIDGRKYDCYGIYHGLYIERSTVNVISSNIIQPDIPDAEYGIHVRHSDLKVINSTIPKAGFIVVDCHAVALNTTFDKSKVEIYHGSLEVQWYLHILVTDENFTPVENAEVKVEDNYNGSLSHNYLTDLDGFVQYAIVTEYIEVENGYRTYYTPHSVTAWTKDLIGFASPKPFMNCSKTIYIVLKPGKFILYLKNGWNLLSLPLIQQETDLVTVLKDIEGNYSSVQWYEINDGKGRWKHYHILKPSFMNNLHNLSHKMGLFVHVTAQEEIGLILNGSKPTTNQFIPLKAGWNLVGYPATTNRLRDDALNNLIFGTDIGSIWTFDARLQKWEEIGESDYFELGRGYWIYSKHDCDWLVFSPILNLDKNRYYPTIQEAIDDANPFDTLEISSGIYNEGLTINTPLTLIGKDNQTCVIKGNREPTIKITSDNVTISNLNLPDGIYGVYITNSKNIHILNNVIYNHRICIFAYNSSMLISNNQISNDPIRTGGAGISFRHCKDSIIENNIINDTVYSVYMMYTSIVIRDNEISPTDGFDEKLDSIGIALYHNSNSTVTNNMVNGGDVGIGVEYGSYPSIERNVISDSEYYGILIKNYGSPTLNENSIKNCKEYGIYSKQGRDVKIMNNTFINNDITLSNSTISNLWLSTGNAFAINTTITDYQVDGGELTVQWFMHVKVVNYTNDPISGADVEVKDNSNGTFDEIYTSGLDGYVNFIIITEFWQNDVQKIYFTPHNVTATIGFSKGYAEPEPWMDSSKEVIVKVDYP